jgi:hypothetical protein
MILSRGRIMQGMEFMETAEVDVDLGSMGIRASLPILDRHSPLIYSIAQHVRRTVQGAQARGRNTWKPPLDPSERANLPLNLPSTLHKWTPSARECVHAGEREEHPVKVGSPGLQVLDHGDGVSHDLLGEHAGHRTHRWLIKIFSGEETNLALDLADLSKKMKLLRTPDVSLLDVDNLTAYCKNKRT